MNNKYYYRSQISEKKFREIIKYFSYDFDATKIALLTNISRNTINKIIGIIQGKILEGSTINTDGWKAYDGLVLNGYTHHRVFHSHDEFARGKCHVNGIESFWSLSF